MNRLTSLITAVVGMAFFLTSLLMGIWSEVDPVNLVERTLLGGVVGIICGFIIGQIYSQALSEWLTKNDEPSSIESSEEPEPEPPEGLPVEKPELQPWNPPRINNDNQGS